MAVQQTNDQGNLWFLSANDSNKKQEMANDPFVQLLFQGSPHSDSISVYGRAIITEDKAKIKTLWNPLLKTLFTEDEDDSRISVIMVTPAES